MATCLVIDVVGDIRTTGRLTKKPRHGSLHTSRTITNKRNEWSGVGVRLKMENGRTRVEPEVDIRKQSPEFNKYFTDPQNVGMV